MSNVEAVQSAQAALKSTEQKAKDEIREYKEAADNKIYEAIATKNIALRKAKEKVKAAKKSKNTAWGSFLISLLCCFAAHPAFSWDLMDFVTVPTVWVWDSLNSFIKWLYNPYYTKFSLYGEQQIRFSGGLVWILRIFAITLLPLVIVITAYIAYSLILYYRKRWCSLSLKVLLASLVIIIVFGDAIQMYIKINLVLLLVIIQLLYLGVIIYFDGYFKTRNHAEDWVLFQKS